MSNQKKVIEEFSIEELESRLEMKQPWVVEVCPGDQCSRGPYS